MNSPEEIKGMVQQKYGEIAKGERADNLHSCCGGTSCSTEVYNIMGDDYSTLEGYNPEADLGLGCGLPTAFAGIKRGDVVVDLGSGAGNDCFIARRETGEEGFVIGIDFSPEMIEKARANTEKMEYDNVVFAQGDIEDLPINNNIADVVISNCVLNLVPDKEKAFNEIYRIMAANGHFSISDVVLVGELPSKLREAAEMYAGCVAGALQKDEYLAIIENAGFQEVQVVKEKLITIPDDILANYLSPGEIQGFKDSGTGIYSITVNGKRAGCCGCGCGC